MFKWKFPNPFGRKSRKGITKKIVLGICAMDKKTKSKPMREILDRLPRDLFEIRIFGDECILNEPVESWPVVEVLITFYSTKFPTDKALEYIKLRKPFLINDLSMESTLQDRRKVYNLLEQCGIDVPRHVFVSRDENGDTYDIEEFDEYIMINGEQLNKPFVEKPVYAEDHNIYIYYPISAGGGSKRLFRKVEDKSAEFYPHINEIRREGSYIYEEFVTTQGTDVKVYTVGAEYGHAEARKSPVVDGRVKRDSEGREVRYPVILSPIEKEMARKIVQAFRQTVCGFDILRVQGKSYCCDVNGFSFVKNSRKYYEDAAQILTEIMLNNLRQEYQLPPSIQTKRVPSPALSQTHPSSSKVIRTRDASMSVTAMDNVYVPTVVADEANSSVHGGNRPPSPSPSIVSEFEYANPTLYSANQRRYETEELRSVIAIIRHGDRTPKQKIKVVISEQLYLDYFHSYVKTPKKDLKVKSKSGLVKFLEVTRDIIQDRNTANELRRKLIQLRDVLERWEISGINRKLQMKPQKWDEDEIVETEEWVDLPDDGESDVDLQEGNRSTLVLSREASTSVIPVVDARLSSSELAAPKAAATGTEGAPDTTEVDVPVPVNDTENGQERVSTPSPIVPIGEDATSVLGTTSTATPTRRRQLVKTKKVVREGTGHATEILVILKWGGDLTPLGREQAEKLGERFRNENYPDHDNGGVLRLHATYRHDLKIKASDEGRVMKTAAAFTKGLLELEGQLTPILASLVTIEEKNRTMLDRGGNFEMKEEMDRCKKHLNLLQVDQDVTDDLIEQIVPGCSETTRRAFHDLGNPLEKLRRMHYLIDKICTQLEFLCIRREESGLGVDDSLVMTDYILPASNSTTAVSAPSPIALNMVGINLPEPVAAAPSSATVAATAGTSDSGVGEDASAVVDGSTTALAAEGTAPPSGISPLQVPLPGTDTSGAIAAGEATASVPTTAAPPSTAVVSPEPEDLSFMNTLYLNETFDLMLERWKKLHKDFYSSKTNQYDLTKLPDVYDMIRYDVLHNQHLNFTGMDELYALAKLFEVVVVPQEYGIDAADKRYIGSKMCGALLEKIKHDLTIASGVDSGLNGQDPMLFQLDHSHAEDLRINSIGRVVRTRLYFTSESHLHTILNVFRYPKPNSPFAFGKEAMDKLEEITNVSYLSQIVIRLFEDRIERGKFSCEVSFSSGSMQHDPVVMSTTTLPLDSPYLLGPYIYLDRSLNLYQLLGCLDDAIELYHNTDKHTTNAMLLAASGQMSVNRLTPLPSEDVGDGLGAVDGSDGTLKVHPEGQETDGEEHDALAHGTGTAADGQLGDACCCAVDDIAGDAVVSAATGDAGDTGSVAVGEGRGSCVTPTPSTNASSSLSRQSSVKRSNTVPTTTTTSSKHTTPMQASTSVSSGSSKRPPMSASSVHGQRRLLDDDHEVVDADPEPVIDSVHSSPVRQSLTRSGGSKKASGYNFGTDADDHAGQATRPAFASRHSSKAWKPAKLDDLSSPSPMRRNYSVTVNIDEASDNWERLEKTLFTLHPMHHSHPPPTASAMPAGVAAGAGAGDGSMGGGLSGSATSISRSRQQELDLLTRRAIAAQLHQQQQQQLQMHSVFQGSPSTFTASTTTAAAGATAGSGDSSTTTTPLRVPAKRAVSLGSSEVLSTSAANAFVAPPSLPSSTGASTETVAATDAPPVSTDAASSVAPFSAAPPQNDSPVAPAIVAEAPVAPCSDVPPPPPPPPITTTSPSQLVTASTSFSNPASSRKRTGSLSADNIVLLDRDRATSDLGLVSESRVLAATPTAAAAAGVLIVDSSASVAGGNGTVTVVKASPVTVDASSSSQLSVAVPASPHQRPSTSSQQSAGDYDLQVMSEATTPGTGMAGATNAATDAAAPGVVTTTSTTNGDVIVVQRSLSDIENRRLKDSLYLASDFYVPPSPPPASASASASGPTADSNSTQQPR